MGEVTKCQLADKTHQMFEFSTMLNELDGSKETERSAGSHDVGKETVEHVVIIAMLEWVASCSGSHGWGEITYL